METMNNTTIKQISKKMEHHVDKFQTLITIANPFLDKDYSKYKLDEQMLISDFTRIVNLQQIIYILQNYDTKIQSAKSVLTLFIDEMDRLLKHYIDSFGNFPDTHIYDLMIKELQMNFIESTPNIFKNMHLIGLEAYKIEKDFQIRYFNYCLEQLNKNLLKKKKIEEIHQTISLLNDFEISYHNYILEIDDTKQESGIHFEDLIYQHSISEISYTANLLKNTISFCGEMQSGKSFISKAFNLMFDSFHDKLDLSSVTPNVLTGHIYYFRLFNIVKMMTLAQQTGVDATCNNMGIMEILEQLVLKSKDQIESLLCMTTEQVENIFTNDCTLLFGQSEWETPDNVELLFCTYLNIEVKWRQYELLKIQANIQSEFDKLTFRNLMQPFLRVKRYAKEFETSINYYERLNMLNGKVIEFS